MRPINRNKMKIRIIESGTSEGVRKSWVIRRKGFGKDWRRRWGNERVRGEIAPLMKAIAIRLKSGKILRGKRGDIHADIVGRYSNVIGNKLKSAGFIDRKGRYYRTYNY